MSNGNKGVVHSGFKRKDNFFTKSKTFKTTNTNREVNDERAANSKGRSYKIGKKTKFQAKELDEQNNESRNSDFFVKPSNSGGTDNEFSIVDKKPFDKKKWRLQKYSKKYKLQQWEDKRKKAVLREYYREIKDDGVNLNMQRIYDEYSDDHIVEGDKETLDVQSISQETNTSTKSEDADNSKNNDVKPPISGRHKGRAFKKAHLEFERIKGEKQKKREEALKRKTERAEALKLYKTKKVEKFKRLNKKTKKGQPVMKERMEMLLEQIERNLSA